MRRRAEGLTDYARLNAMTEEALEASIDVDDEGEFDWSAGQPGIPAPKPPAPLPFDET